MSKTSKAYREAAEKVDRDRLYTRWRRPSWPKETSVEEAGRRPSRSRIRLGVDPARPTRWCAAPSTCLHGTGKTARVAVFAVGEKAEAPPPPAPTSSAATT